MCVIDIDECNCICHTGMTVAHMMACCEQCPYCGKNIKYTLDRHLKEHEKEDLKAVEEMENEGNVSWFTNPLDMLADS